MMRYHLMNGHLTLAFKDWSIVDKNRSNLDPIEELPPSCSMAFI